ncbi:hypothetical protein BDZ94DRAFT_1305592 [Collybia nuda]|uniref:Uncharacterized protein n=1 Tax=Collybia nuda TaxID=64659 RepID=A0A9P5YEL7_9AGAR|nr:hypothetical protein BDZ94DRAFT_1305592 [Collybia nuda]
MTSPDHPVDLPLLNKDYQDPYSSSHLTSTNTSFETFIYLTLLVYLTQQLSLRRNLSAKQTLTATHDNSTAWTGLGSALASLWSQTTIPASVGAVTAITLYLICTATLKVSTPSWFTVVSFQTNITTCIQTDIGSPFFTFPDDWSFAAKSSALPYISQLPTTSLLGNTLFDVLSDNNGTGAVTVNTTTFNVICGELPWVGERAQVYPNDTVKLDQIAKDNDDVRWVLSVPVPNTEGGLFDDYVGYLSTMAPNTLQIISFPYLARNENYALGGPNIIIISSTPIRDSTGSGKSVFPLEVPMSIASPLHKLQAIGCTLSITNQTGFVDSQSKKLLIPPVRKTESTWLPWKPLKDTGSWLINAWPEILTTGLPSSRATTGEVYLQYYDLSGFVPPFLSVTEAAIMVDVGYLPKNQSSMEDIDHNPILVRLHDLENALENVTAALFWSASHLGESELEKPQNRTGAAIIQQPIFASHLKLNGLPIITGLCTSIILLLLAIRLVGIKEHDLKPPVERVGMLHMFWLSGIGSVAQERIARVEEPTTQSLREAGMFKMRISDGGVCIVEDVGSLAKRE